MSWPDALLCTDGPVKSLVDLALAPEPRRGHGALYDGLNCGRLEVARFRAVLSALPLPRAADGRIVLAVDPASHEAMVLWAMIALMGRRLAQAAPATTTD